VKSSIVRRVGDGTLTQYVARIGTVVFVYAGINT